MTTDKQNETNHFYEYIPTIGIFLFYGLYLFCATLYPGGSQADTNAAGFSWLSNYTCDLFHTHSINGLLNPARSIGLIAVFIICASLGYFFYQLSQIIPMTSFWKRLLQITGGLCMICAVLIFTDLHHIMVPLASIFGLFALTSVIRGFLKNKLYHHIWIGGTCIFLLILNNYFYYSDTLTTILPLIQKITIVLILSWIIWLNFELVKNKNKYLPQAL